MSLYLGENLISGVATPTEPTRNIGQIIQSTIPLSDAGLHLLDGALINGSGIYADFVTAIGNLTTDYPDLFETEANWQQSVTDYGVCGKFVYTQGTLTYYAWYVFNTQSTIITFYTTSLNSSVGDNVYNSNGEVIGTLTSGDSGWNVFNGAIRYNTNLASRNSNSDILGSSATVRLPKITGIVEGTTDLTALGDLVEAGLPNITGSRISNYAGAATDVTINWEGALYSTGSTSGALVGGDNSSLNNIGFDASRSSLIYGNSTTVQPQTIKVLYYIVIATSTKTEIEVDIDEIATDLNGKMDTDLTNMSASQSAKNTIMSWSMPDYANKISFSFNDVNSYTTPSKGYISVESITMNNGADIFQLFINNVMVCWLQANNGGWDRESTGLYMVESGDVITYYGWAQHKDMAFYPMKGAN